MKVLNKMSSPKSNFVFLNSVKMSLFSLTGWKRQGVLFLCGALTSFALPPFYLTPLCFLTFPVFIVLLDKISALQNNRKCLLIYALSCGTFGFGYFIFGFWWLCNALLTDPITFGWAVPFAIFCPPLYLSLYWFFAGFIVGFLWTKGIARFFILAFALGLAEWLRSILFTGFPWNALGYTAMPTPMLMQSDAIFGLYGMNILAVFIYSLPTVLFTDEKKKTALFLCLALILAHCGFGFYRLNTAPKMTDYQKSSYWVRIVQPSIEQNTKLSNTEREAIFAAHMNLSATSIVEQHPEPDFIVWPEASIPYLLYDNSTITMRIASLLKPKQWAIIGAIRASNNPLNEKTQYFNTIAVINATGNILTTSDKLHLVPFGEYLPYQNLLKKIGLHALADTIGGYSTASVRKTVMMPNGFSYLPLICYEAIFPNEMVFKGSPPQAIINVTNDAWFGVTPGPYQHLQQVQLRAVELGIPLIRAANNGISAVIDSYGRIVVALQQNAVGIVDSPIPSPITPIGNNEYRIFSTFILFILMLLCGLGFGSTKQLK
ncbi:apolipoprotein N-acyltransferase [Bartonella henselae]|uniref:Apolipoprotein N-acyltransferase n=2 Tax=Bartonella TaxID=773 RepID=A0A0H3LVJ8_BARHE|nr:apolipoprotein N-acyltransferase [Bartonella henselae]ATP11857.1 apolipoprotein N-acyltransferase [Bartonella henselae]MDM9982917.1 apolipoprotein N-acyltransferase [Bartonella henselae]MDM9984434.1 apolipoprotein N-acyltransferase [Bartonella henselae]MDM9985925.1 apolipoprotein N-acyltransferase [Bartonella henselae]MDM9987495.1 apolipoprotein N-acyltransferase [Bartonella henselae]